MISVDDKGEFTFRRKSINNVYLISTNFNKANIANTLDYQFKRFGIPEAMLSGIHSAGDLTVDLFRNTLDSVHQKGIFNTT